MCWVDPTPTEVNVTRPGSLAARASRSSSVLAGWSARTAITKGKDETVDRKLKSLTGS
ncbi:hypothetical protein D3C71_1200300 [compost metagenome]